MLDDVLVALGSRPLSQGRSVAVVSNAGGLGILAADACVGYGLNLLVRSDATVDTTAVVDDRARALALLSTSDADSLLHGFRSTREREEATP